MNKRIKQLFSALTAFCLALSLVPSTALAADSANGNSGNFPFTDVAPESQSYEAVQYVYDKGMMSGTSATTFSPGGTTTRGAIVTILHRLEGTPAASGQSFPDVPDGYWCKDAVSWASSNQIVNGYGNGNFGPRNNITREQMAAILYRYSAYKGYDVSKTGSISSFSDADKVGSFATDSMGWAIGSGLISGVGNNTLAPKGNATRAQAAMILMRYCKNIIPSTSTPETPSTPAPDDRSNQTYTVSFDLNYNGSGTAPDSQTVKHGETITKPANPTRSGYIFGGWYASKNGGRLFDFNSGITSDLTLYAYWSKENNGGNYTTPSTSGTPSTPTPVNQYTVTFNSNGGSAVQAQIINAGGLAQKPADPSKADFSFDGWYTDSALTTLYDFSKPVTGNVTLYAKWSPISKTYTVTFNSNGGSAVQAQIVNAGGLAQKPADPGKADFSFDGWYMDSALTTLYDFSKPVTGNMTLYAKWSPISETFTVIFYINDGTDSTYTTTSVVADEAVAEPATPTREGFIFNGWYEDTECTELYDFELLVMENIKLYAGWKEPGPYSITFNSAGGSAVPSQIIMENQLVAEPEDPERTGYTFLGWLTEEDVYFEFDEAVNKNLVLTADWIEESEIDQTLDDILNAGGPETTEQLLDGGKGITSIEVSGELNDTGKIVATQLKTGPMLNIPGYLTAVDVNALGGTVTDATIAFRYDPTQLSADGIEPQDLAIVWYDEENDIVVLLDSDVDTANNIVFVSTNHFSKYAVVNVAEWMAAQTTQLPTIRTDEVPYYSIVMAMDCSGSMDGDKMSKSIEAAQNMIDVLADEDRITLLAFESSTRVVLDQVQLVTIDEDGNEVDNRDAIKSQIGSLNAYGGTDIERVLQHALQSKSDDAQYQSFVILLSDGQSSVYNSTLASLKANGQRVIAVGIGNDVDQPLMQRIADSTDGTYLFCQNAGDLAAAFKALQDAYIGSTEDSDGDGLPDLVETTGMRDQYGEIWKTNPNNSDSDGDGISDGEEMGSYHPFTLHPYFQRVSRPDLYTVKSDEAYLLMPEKMMYSLDMDNNKLKLEVYVSDGGYRMVPDLLTPPDPDGIAKEYIYSPPRNLKVELSGLPDGVVIDSLNTVDEGLIPGTMATSYKTTAILSYTKSVVLENVTWTVTADNCSEWSGYAEDGIKATYVRKTQSVPATKVKPKQEISQADQARLDLAQAALDISNKLFSKVEMKSNEPANNVDAARAKVRDMIHVSGYWHKEDANPPDSLYDAFAMAILNALDGSALEKFEKNQNKMANQIFKQIKNGSFHDTITETINGVQYTVQYDVEALYGTGVGFQIVTWYTGSKSHQVILTWENVSNKDGCKALADFCAALAQLNKDLWTDFMSYYVSDAFGLMGIKTVTKEDVDKVFAAAEKVIKALCNKDDADALVREMGDKAEEKLKSGLTNKFKSFIKDNIPHGDKIVKAAEHYKTAKEKYEEFQRFLSSSDEKKAAKAFSKFQDAYKKLDAEIDSI